MNIVEAFEKSKIVIRHEKLELNSVDYEPHKIFQGVFIKHIIKGSSTGNQISCHLVKIEPHCSLDFHKHIENLELHEIICGSGTCTIDSVEANYSTGTIGVIPKNTSHKVTAGKDGIYILAKFIPALF